MWAVDSLLRQCQAEEQTQPERDYMYRQQTAVPALQDEASSLGRVIYVGTEPGTLRERHPLPVEEGSRLSLQPRFVMRRRLGVNSAVLYPLYAFMS